MNFHFLTQPLPRVVAPLLHAQPDIVKKVSYWRCLYANWRFPYSP